MADEWDSSDDVASADDEESEGVEECRGEAEEWWDEEPMPWVRRGESAVDGLKLPEWTRGIHPMDCGEITNFLTWQKGGIIQPHWAVLAYRLLSRAVKRTSIMMNRHTLPGSEEKDGRDVEAVEKDEGAQRNKASTSWWSARRQRSYKVHMKQHSRTASTDKALVFAGRHDKNREGRVVRVPAEAAMHEEMEAEAEGVDQSVAEKHVRGGGGQLSLTQMNTVLQGDHDGERLQASDDADKQRQFRGPDEDATEDIGWSTTKEKWVHAVEHNPPKWRKLGSLGAEVCGLVAQGAYTISLCADDHVRVHDVNTRKMISAVKRKGMSGCVAFWSGAIACPLDDSSIWVLDLVTGLCLATARGHEGVVTCLDMKESLLLSGDHLGTVRLWDLDRHAEMASSGWLAGSGDALARDAMDRGRRCLVVEKQAHQGRVDMCCVSDDKCLYASGGGNSVVHVRYFKRDEEGRVQTQIMCSLLGHCAHNDECTCTHGEGQDSYQQDQRCSVQGHAGVILCCRLCTYQDGCQWRLATGGADGRVIVWDLKLGGVEHDLLEGRVLGSNRLRYRGGVWCLCVHAGTVVSGDSGGGVTVSCLESGRVIKSFRPLDGFPVSCITARRGHIVVGGDDGSIVQGRFGGHVKKLKSHHNIKVEVGIGGLIDRRREEGGENISHTTEQKRERGVYGFEGGGQDDE